MKKTNGWNIMASTHPLTVVCHGVVRLEET